MVILMFALFDMFYLNYSMSYFAEDIVFVVVLLLLLLPSFLTYLPLNRISCYWWNWFPIFTSSTFMIDINWTGGVDNDADCLV